MPINRGSFFSPIALAGALLAGSLVTETPALAGSSASAATHELAAQSSRPRITIYPRRLQPSRSAKRHCRAWLATEYRVSGPVIVPRQQCWWQ